jgi:hypothetical protein
MHIARESLMPERIHLVMERSEKERYRRAAARQGKTLSQWLREAADEKLAASELDRPLDTPEALDAFFAACDRREEGREPDWEQQKERIAASRTRNLPPA